MKKILIGLLLVLAISFALPVFGQTITPPPSKVNQQLIESLKILIEQFQKIIFALQQNIENQDKKLMNDIAPTTVDYRLEKYSRETKMINTLDYFLNKSGKSLTGSHPLSQTTINKKIYYVKWDNQSYEVYEYDNEYLYLREDHSGSPHPGSYTFSNGKWMKLFMQVGEKIDVVDNVMYGFVINNNLCAPYSSGMFPYNITLERRISNYDLGGDLGRQDVIILKYDYSNAAVNDYEKSYYAKGWGLVKWELYRNNKVIQSSIFNKISSNPIMSPDLKSSCINTSFIPNIPTNLNEFINLLYNCVLNNNNPDGAGFNFWLNNLESGKLNIKGAYREFYNIQNNLNPPVSNDLFTRLLYRCMLFREVDSVSYNNVINGLSDGSLTRDGLVENVLNSIEFNTNILPKLQALLSNPIYDPDVPPLPTSLSDFIGTLYSCVLNNNNPDSAGFNFWLNNLKNRALTVQEIYKEFFNYQKDVVPLIDDQQFAKKLYGCILFRPVDKTSYDNVIKALTASVLSRQDLVQKVLNSEEFIINVFPKLQALIK